MKKVLLVLAVATVFVACDSKKKEEEKPATPAIENPVTPPPATNSGDTGKGAAADTNKSKMDHLKDAGAKVGEGVKDVKAGDMKGAAENGKGAVESVKKAAQ